MMTTMDRYNGNKGEDNKNGNVDINYINIDNNVIHDGIGNGDIYDNGKTMMIIR